MRCKGSKGVCGEATPPQMTGSRDGFPRFDVVHRSGVGSGASQVSPRPIEADVRQRAHATHLDSKMVPSGRRAGRAPDHGRFASSPRAVVAVVVVVISCRASTGQSIGSRMTWDGSSRTPGAREEGRRRARRKHERHAGLLAVGGRRVLRRRQHRRGAHRARRERAERQGVRRLGGPKTASRSFLFM